jgi:predicted ATPase
VPISHLSVQGYRSIRTLWTRLGNVTVVLGPNGSGKTNLYRSLALLVEAAHGRLARSVAREGGMPSLMWAGGRVLVRADEMLRVGVRMQMPGIQRPLEATELSDGTLRYLCLAAALLTPRPPELLALNEPETSLHPQLLAPLGRLIARARARRGRDSSRRRPDG